MTQMRQRPPGCWKIRNGGIRQLLLFAAREGGNDLSAATTNHGGVYADNRPGAGRSVLLSGRLIYQR